MGREKKDGLVTLRTTESHGKPSFVLAHFRLIWDNEVFGSRRMGSKCTLLSQMGAKKMTQFAFRRGVVVLLLVVPMSWLGVFPAIAQTGAGSGASSLNIADTNETALAAEDLAENEALSKMNSEELQIALTECGERMKNSYMAGADGRKDLFRLRGEVRKSSPEVKAVLDEITALKLKIDRIIDADPQIAAKLRADEASRKELMKITRKGRKIGEFIAKADQKRLEMMNEKGVSTGTHGTANLPVTGSERTRDK